MRPDEDAEAAQARVTMAHMRAEMALQRKRLLHKQDVLDESFVLRSERVGSLDIAIAEIDDLLGVTYLGSGGERRGVGDSGCCEASREVSHVEAHLGCGDGACATSHE